MKDHKCLIHVYFLENYACYSSEIQAVKLCFAGNTPNWSGGLHVGRVEDHECFGTISSSKHNTGKKAIPICFVLSCSNVGSSQAPWTFLRRAFQMGLEAFSKDKGKDKAKNLPDSLPVVPSTMFIHKEVTQRQISYCDVSCVSSTSQILECHCYSNKTFTFKVQAIASTQEDNSQNLPKISWQNFYINRPVFYFF